MKGWRFLRDKKDVIQVGDEMRIPGRRPRWEVVGSHVAGIRYTRHYFKMTLRRRMPNKMLCAITATGGKQEEK